MFSIQAYGTYGRNYVRTFVTHENMMFVDQKCCYTRQCYMSEPILPTKVICLWSELILHTIIFNVRAYITHEYEMVTLHTTMCNVRAYVTHEYEMVSVRTYVTYRNVICPKVCYTRKFYVLCPNSCYKKCNVICYS